MFFANNLQYLRKTTGGMTQERLAEKLGVSRQTISKWESGEAWPEIPKLLDLCEIFQCKLDDLLRQDLSAGAAVFFPVRLERVQGFRMAQYLMISPDPRNDVRIHMEQWAHRSGLLELPGCTPKCIGWPFPYVTAEQKNRFGLQGYACGYALPEDFEPQASGVQLVQQETADYAVMTVQDPFSTSCHRITRAYQLIFDYLSSRGIQKSAKEGSLPCFEYIYEKNGSVFMDVYIHCVSIQTPDITTKFT